jgi:beta-lactamase class C
VEDGMDLQLMLQELQKVNVIAKPGELYSYQNVAYSIIGEVIRSRTGKPYQRLMDEKVFTPLNMRDASMSYDEIMLNDNVAKPHLHWRKGWKATTIQDTYYNVGPAGGVNASIADMAEWLKVMLGTKKNFVKEETLDRIFTPVVKAKSKNRYFRKWVGRSDSHYALGWRVLNFKNDTLLYHGGYVRGYRSEVAIDRRSRIGICVLSNGPGRLVDNSVPMFFNLFYNQRDSILHWQNKQLVLSGETQTVTLK